MTNAHHPEIPNATIRQPYKQTLPLVWIVPAIAALIGLWLVVQQMMHEGPTVTLRFKSAEGIEPGKTKIRFKDVDIGEVKTVAVSDDRTQVVLTAKLVKQASDYLAKDTRFWVVRPRIAGGAVSGLGTLLSGAYIGVDIGKSKDRSTDFVGLDVPPIVTRDLPGREFILHSPEIGSLDVGAIVSFRQLTVGQVTAYNLDRDGKGVTLKVFVNAPYDQYVTNNTRFWHASGIDLSLDANGLKLQTQSLVSLVEGGLAFQTPPDQPIGAPAANDATFELFADRDKAMHQAETEVRSFVVYFKDSLRGLAPGAPVDFHGIVVGEVKSIGVEHAQGEALIHFPVEINIYPERMRARDVTGGPKPKLDEATLRALVGQLVNSGMRAQLKTGNLLTGQLYISLDFYNEAPKGVVDWSHAPPVLPSIDGGLGEIQNSMASILKKVDKIPVEQLSNELLRSMKSLNQALDDTDHLVKQLNTDVAPEFKATLSDARGTLNSAQKVLKDDSPLQGDLQDALRQVSKSAQAIGNFADYLDQHPNALIFGRHGNSAKEGEARH